MEEAAAIRPDSNEGARSGRDIVVHNVRRGLTSVFATHPSFEPPAYSILNLTGVEGWHGDVDLGPQRSSGTHAPLRPQPDSGFHGGEQDRDEEYNQSAAGGGGGQRWREEEGLAEGALSLSHRRSPRTEGECHQISQPSAHQLVPSERQAVSTAHGRQRRPGGGFQVILPTSPPERTPRLSLFRSLRCSAGG